jgi:hypothetical protein
MSLYSQFMAIDNDTTHPDHNIKTNVNFLTSLLSSPTLSISQKSENSINKKKPIPIHFTPREILRRSMLLGGIGIPMAKQKAARDRINYFLFNIHHSSTNSQKFEASIIYTQLEVGIFSSSFTAEFERYRSLATQSMCVQIWRETQPLGVQIRHAEQVTWLPEPMAKDDICIMELATRYYNNEGAYIINRCRLYLQLISIMDLLLYDLFPIHPSYLVGDRPPSCQALIFRPDFPNPPKHYCKLWNHLIHNIVTPMIKKPN